MERDGAITNGTNAPRPWWLTAAFVLLAVVTCVYVALATGHRDEVAVADAWEHHRAVRVMAELGLAPGAGLNPGNPTHLDDAPSIRYSPYTVALAALVRASGGSIDAYAALSIAAVVNTAMLFAALWIFLRSLRAPYLAWLAAPCMLFFWGTAPGYANTLAWADLPWHQVNPSAMGLWLCLLCWALWEWASHQPRRLAIAVPVVAPTLAVCLLSHGMTGALGGVGLMAISMAHHGRLRVVLVAGTLLACVLAAIACTLWPAYSFVRAITLNPDGWYWYNPGIVELMLTNWCLPALLACVLALPMRSQRVVRVCLWALLGIAGLTVFAIATRSATFARLPLAGMVFAFVLIAVALDAFQPWRASSWLATLGGLCSLAWERCAASWARVVVVGLLVFFAVPQLIASVREPHLLRPLLAEVTGRDPKTTNRLDLYRQVLAGVAERDVVYADQVVSWPVPSIAGRVVGAHHLEFFTTNNRERLAEGDELFLPATTDARRAQLLRQHQARWILLDDTRNGAVLEALAPPAAVVRRVGPLTLVDAQRWLAERTTGG